MSDLTRVPDDDGGGRGKRSLAVGLSLVLAGVFVATGGFGLLGPADEGKGRRPARSAAPRQVSSPGAASQAASAGLEVGAKAPSLSLPDIHGKMSSLQAFRGRPVVLNIWATWCPPCVKEMPSLEALHGSAGEDFALLSVAVDEDLKAVRSLADLMGLTFPILLDPDGSHMARWGTVKFPETWILDSEGVVVERIIGAIDWSSPSVRLKLKTLAESGTW